MEYMYQMAFATSTYIIIFGMVSRFTRDTLHLPDSVLAMLYGGIIGMYTLILPVSDGYEPEDVLFGFARVVIALQAMNIALKLPNGYIFKKATSLLVLLFIVSFVSCIVTFVIVASLSEFDIPDSWAIAAACTPSDPVLSSTILHGCFSRENMPERIRLLITSENGISDGVSLILLYVLLDLFMKPPRRGIKAFLKKALFLKIVCPVFMGYFVGRVLLFVLKLSHSKRLVGNGTMTVFGISLAIVGMCTAILLKECESIFIFFMGTAFGSSEWFVLETRGSHFQDVVENIFNLSFFIFLGSRIEWPRMTMQSTLISFMILFFRRPPAVLMFYKFIPEIRTSKEALVVGWTGPVGVSALYYAIFADRITGSNTISFMQFLVAISIVVHGLTAPAYKLCLMLSGNAAHTVTENQEEQLTTVRI